MDADLRYWSSLVGNIRLASVNAPDGVYRLSVIDKNGRVVYNRGEVEIRKGGFLDLELPM
jgi:hypothetical protein